MNTTKRQSVRRQGGSAFILVVVVTVLLAVIGLMFVMVARLGEMGSSAVVDNADLDAAVQTVVSRINTALVADLFGADGVIGSDGPHYTWPGVARGDNPLTGNRIVPWLASLEPNSLGLSPVDDYYRWDYITDLSSAGVVPKWDLVIRDGKKIWNLPEFGGIVEEYQNFADYYPGNTPLTVALIEGLPADASGDGVADSIWIRLPNASTSRGKPVFAAIRIIDNCAMLNLNTAYCFYQTPYSAATPISPFSKFWYLNQTAHGNGIAYEGTAISSSTPYGDGGRYLTEINYLSFLRGSDLAVLWGGGGDGWYNITNAKKFSWLNASSQIVSVTPEQAHVAILSIENPPLHPVILPQTHFSFFDIGDELEIRNRYLMTSKTESRFERHNVGNYTFDAGGGDFAALTVPREDKMEEKIPHLARWKWRIDPVNFDNWSGAFVGTWDAWVGKPIDNRYKYDRRHISTFYSFDRPLRTGQYPTFEMDAAIHGLTPAQRAVFVPDKAMPIDLRTADITDATTIVQLLYALREVYDAQKAAQIVVNLIDYVDSDNEVSILNTERISAYIFAAGGGVSGMAMANDFGLGDAVVYGYERQPFISEIYTQISSFGVVERFAIELLNPYDADIDISGWEIVFTSTAGVETAYSVPSGAVLSANRGRRVLCSQLAIPVANETRTLMPRLMSLLNTTQSVELRRPTTAEPLAVDRISREIILQMVTNPSTGNSIHNSSKRDDRDWRIASAHFTTPTQTAAYSGTLGTSNGEEIADASNYQLPVANDDQPIERLADFIRVAFVSNTGGDDPNTITELIADAEDEADIRYDMEAAPDLLDYICFLNRPDQGSLPGRININTAALHVIAAAIPPQLVMAAADDAEHALYLAEQIVANRPYERVSDLLRINAFKKFAQTGTPNVGDQGVEGDFEERDWIVSRLANIFTVRSDTFTAYILVRLGDDGPQRRMIAIFDRSQVWTPSDRPRLVALHPVPEAR